SVQPGARARVGTIEVQAPNPITPQTVLAEIDLSTGALYDGVAVDAKLAKYVDHLRSDGYYEARATHLPRYVDDDRVVNITIAVDPGPHVELVFEGDVLSARDRADLVPIVREHSVNEDILEDSKFAIERHFQSLGYCAPRADYARHDESG